MPDIAMHRDPRPIRRRPVRYQSQQPIEPLLAGGDVPSTARGAAEHPKPVQGFREFAGRAAQQVAKLVSQVRLVAVAEGGR